MARSHYIYVVEKNHSVIGAFTVKHEMLRFVKGETCNPEYKDALFHVFRMRDGVGGEPLYIDFEKEL